MREKNVGSQSGTNTKDVLTIMYDPIKILWRTLFPYGLIILWFGNVWLRILSSEYIGMKYYFGLIFFGVMVLGSCILILEMYLFKSLKFKPLYVEKEWYFFGRKKIEYRNSRLKGITSLLFSSKNFFYINKLTFWGRKCFGYDEKLLKNKDQKMVNEFLAKKFSVSVNELNKIKIDIKYKEQ